MKLKYEKYFDYNTNSPNTTILCYIFRANGHRLPFGKNGAGLVGIIFTGWDFELLKNTILNSPLGIKIQKL